MRKLKFWWEASLLGLLLAVCLISSTAVSLNWPWQATVISEEQFRHTVHAEYP